MEPVFIGAVHFFSCTSPRTPRIPRPTWLDTPSQHPAGCRLHAGLCRQPGNPLLVSKGADQRDYNRGCHNRGHRCQTKLNGTQVALIFLYSTQSSTRRIRGVPRSGRCHRFCSGAPHPGIDLVDCCIKPHNLYSSILFFSFGSTYAVPRANTTVSASPSKKYRSYLVLSRHFITQTACHNRQAGIVRCCLLFIFSLFIIRTSFFQPGGNALAILAG